MCSRLRQKSAMYGGGGDLCENGPHPLVLDEKFRVRPDPTE